MFERQLERFLEVLFLREKKTKKMGNDFEWFCDEVEQLASRLQLPLFDDDGVGSAKWLF